MPKKAHQPMKNVFKICTRRQTFTRIYFNVQVDGCIHVFETCIRRKKFTFMNFKVRVDHLIALPDFMSTQKLGLHELNLLLDISKSSARPQYEKLHCELHHMYST